MKGWMLILASTSAIALISPAHAQQLAGLADSETAAASGAGATQARSQSVDEASGGGETTFGDIVVTARRRSERLQDVPLSVTAFSPEALSESRIVGRTDLANYTPSLITITGGYPSEFAFFALRGQGPAFGSVPGVINYFAEVPALVGIDGRVGSYFDLANVQVLSGPQGTLFGKNATGGNILFEPQRPTDRQEGYLQLEVGNLQDVRAEFAVNLPIVSDKILFRIAGEEGRRDGYTRDVGPYFPGKKYDNLDYQSVRASLIVRPTDNVELYTVARYYHSRTNGPGTVLTQFNPALGVPAAPALLLFPGLATAVADQQDRGPRQVSYDLDQFSSTSYWQVLNQARVDLTDELTLKNIVSYSEMTYRYAYDYDASPFPIGGQTSRTGNPTQAPTYLTEELQLQGKLWNDALNFSVGGYYDRFGHHKDQGGLFTQYPLSLLIGQIPAVINTTARSYAVFGQATIDLGKAGVIPGLSLTGGLRHTWDETANFTQISVLPATGGTAKFDYTSYNLSADYVISPGVHVYATSRNAYKAGGVNGPVPEGSSFRTFPPEKLQDVEIGLKSQMRIAGVPTRFNVAAYRGNYRNIQRTTTELIEGALINVTRSAAKGRIQGVEVTAAVEPVRGLTLNGSYSYIDAKYTRVADASAGAILTGSAFPYTPRHKVTLGGSYQADLGSVGTLALSANWAYQSKFSTAQNNLAQVRNLPGYDTLALRAGVNGIGGSNLDLNLFMANATDNSFATGLQDLYNVGGGTVTYTYNEPRTYGAQLRFHW
ncbi:MULTISPECIES: TonB-dependent receptor [unclassified Sphingobium]|uniref:TonB-dependent receptor n=1 Tax=unclassified Sphingobium TaxID=2611147 RepID=UPI00101FB181|nr:MULTISPECIES: TonB-dependent receptor [unclassified Sphingobium]WDA35923.1 TonB-dependent receptor plug domain-containing protein [Sphingobium sp. YC-XJ3]